MSARECCRSNCRESAAVEARGLSGSGRWWSAFACAYWEHQDGAVETLRVLGFTVEGVFPVATAAWAVPAGPL